MEMKANLLVFVILNIYFDIMFGILFELHLYSHFLIYTNLDIMYTANSPLLY